jgi:DNA-binding transcriptional regulator YhcF (GntR family)
VRKNAIGWLKPGRLFVDPHNQVPAYGQIKDQIKLACTYRELQPGDPLPSIRALSRQLGVGDGIVRRAYRELCGMGVLRAEHRKHVVATRALVDGSEASALAQASAEQCDRLMAWARKRRLSAIALGRLLLRLALVQETASPSYAFVDICRPAADELAGKIARAWEVKVAGLSLGEFANLSSADGRRSLVVLANQYLYEEVMRVAGAAADVFPIRMRVGKRLLQRMRRLPARTRVLLLFSDESFPQAAEALLRHYEHLYGGDRRFHTAAVSRISDIARFIETRRYRLFLLTPAVWEQVPARIRRMPAVARAMEEPDLESLEETRIATGVLF